MGGAFGGFNCNVGIHGEDFCKNSGHSRYCCQSYKILTPVYRFRVLKSLALCIDWASSEAVQLHQWPCMRIEAPHPFSSRKLGVVCNCGAITTGNQANLTQHLNLFRPPIKPEATRLRSMELIKDNCFRISELGT